MQKIIFYLIVGTFLTNLLIAKDISSSSLNLKQDTTSKVTDTPKQVYKIPARDIKTLLMKEIELLDQYRSESSSNSFQFRILMITILISLGSLIFLTGIDNKTIRSILCIFFLFVLIFYGYDSFKDNQLSRVEKREIMIFNEYARISEYPDTNLIVSLRNTIANGYTKDNVFIAVDFEEHKPCEKIKSALNPSWERLFLHLLIFVSFAILVRIEKSPDSKKVSSWYNNLSHFNWKLLFPSQWKKNWVSSLTLVIIVLLIIFKILFHFLAD